MTQPPLRRPNSSSHPLGGGCLTLPGPSRLTQVQPENPALAIRLAPRPTFVQGGFHSEHGLGIKRGLVSSYDATHAVNAHMAYQLAFGRGKEFGRGMSRVLDAFVGWQISGT